MTGRRDIRRARAGLVLAALGLAVAAGGCGEEGRVNLSGTVKFGNQPVPYGEVLFSPDADKQNTGPSVVAQIRDGKYQTNPGQGAAVGPGVLRISGYDGPPTVKPGESQPSSKPLFDDYETRLDVPASGTLDLVVPADWKAPQNPNAPRAHG